MDSKTGFSVPVSCGRVLALELQRLRLLEQERHVTSFEIYEQAFRDAATIVEQERDWWKKQDDPCRADALQHAYRKMSEFLAQKQRDQIQRGG